MRLLSALLLVSLIHLSSHCSSKVQFKSPSFQLLDQTTKTAKGEAFAWLSALVDDVGHRVLGSQALDQAIERVVGDLKTEGFDNVHTEDVPGLPNWKRGDDRVTILEPRLHSMNVLAIGGSSPGNVTAEAVVFEDFHALESMNVSGKIVVFVEKWTGYGSTVSYRGAARRVEALGAVAVLVKSVSPFSLYNPHTGSGGTGAKIPAVSITIEEAEMLMRWQTRGKKIIINIDVKSHPLPNPVTSRNTVFQITGSEFPNEVVLLSGHLDSWDVGQGAMDDGGGVAAVLFALKAIRALSLKDPAFRPRRTIRGVFWTAEEEGLLGAQAYFNAHPGNGSSNETFFFVSETDQGAFRPTNWNSFLNFQGTPDQSKRMDDIVRILNAYDIPLSLVQSDSQGDVGFWADTGIASVNYVSDKGRDYYFYFHHTQADYMSIFKEEDLDFTAGIFAVLAHVISNMDSWS